MDWAKRKNAERVAREARAAAETGQAVDRAALREEIRRSAAFRAPRLDWTGKKKARAIAASERQVAEWLARHRPRRW